MWQLKWKMNVSIIEATHTVWSYSSTWKIFKKKMLFLTKQDDCYKYQPTQWNSLNESICVFLKCKRIH